MLALLFNFIGHIQTLVVLRDLCKDPNHGKHPTMGQLTMMAVYCDQPAVSLLRL